MIQNRKGFTLLELLITIAILAVIATIVMVVIDPAVQFRKARDAQRGSATKELQKAIEQYYVKNNAYPANILPGWGNAYPICQQGQTNTSCLNIDAIVPDYIAAIPVDPSETGTLQTGYEVYYDSGRPFVIAPRLGETLPTDYIARYRFTQTEGTTLMDSSGNGNNLVCSSNRCPVYSQSGHDGGYAAKFESTVTPSTYDYFYKSQVI